MAEEGPVPGPLGVLPDFLDQTISDALQSPLVPVVHLELASEAEVPRSLDDSKLTECGKK